MLVISKDSYLIESDEERFIYESVRGILPLILAPYDSALTLFDLDDVSLSACLIRDIRQKVHLRELFVISLVSGTISLVILPR